MWLPVLLNDFIHLNICLDQMPRKKRSKRPKYPAMSPDPEGDIYFPRSNIPRPVYRDLRVHPRFFGIRKRSRKKKIMKRRWD